VRRELGISAESLAIVRQALVGVVNESKGTAFKVRAKDIEVAGKTGTAQVHGRRGGDGSADANDHAWFVGFAPAGRPRVAFAVLVEHGGHGGEVAAPIAMEIVHGYAETVEPEIKNAPRVGLPKRRYAREAEEAAAQADARTAPHPDPLPAQPADGKTEEQP
jgi:cell division protein FtsI/penicillin-binding protein 2